MSCVQIPFQPKKGQKKGEGVSHLCTNAMEGKIIQSEKNYPVPTGNEQTKQEKSYTSASSKDQILEQLICC